MPLFGRPTAGALAGSGGGLTNPLAAGSLGTASLQLVAAGDGLWQPAAHIVGLQANSLEVLRAESVASAVNYLRVIASAATTALQLAAAGSDTNIGIQVVPKGTGALLAPAGSALNALGVKIGVGNGDGFWQRAGGYLSFVSNGHEGFEMNPLGLLSVQNTNNSLWTGFGFAAAGNPGSLDSIITRAAAGVFSFDTSTAGNALAVLKFGTGVCRGRTTTTAAPTTTEYPSDKDWGVHKNSSSGVVVLAYNDGGTIKSVQLS